MKLRLPVFLAGIAIIAAASLGAASALSVSVELAGSASNDGDTPAYAARSGNERVHVTFDSDEGLEMPDGVNHWNVARGLVAYAGFLSDGAQGGNAGLWGTVTVNGNACAFQTWGGVENGPKACALP